MKLKILGECKILGAPGMAHLPSFQRKPAVIKCPPLPDGRATLYEPEANKARAVSRNGASEGSMRQNPCT